jgi:drug/metabolite transporter (DMT)-like permease
MSKLANKRFDGRINGWVNGWIGMLMFSGTLPATKLAVMGFDPLFLTACRGAIAGILAGGLLLLFRQKRPMRQELIPLAMVALCVVLGFPMLTAIALKHVTSAHSMIYIGLLPLFTAIFGVLRGGERPRPVFWLFSAMGSSLVAGFALLGGASSSSPGDGLLLAAVIVCGYGYAEGARLARRLGGWQVICWALVIALPLMLTAAMVRMPETWEGIRGSSWLGLAYVSLFSMLIGFVFWYRGLALGGIASVGQLQLLQPFFGLLLSALVLREPVDLPLFLFLLGVVFCVAFAKRFAGERMPIITELNFRSLIFRTKP